MEQPRRTEAARQGGDGFPRRPLPPGRLLGHGNRLFRIREEDLSVLQHRPPPDGLRAVPCRHACRAATNWSRGISSSSTREGQLGHVGIYIGNNEFVHASSRKRGVRVDNLNTPYYDKRFVRAVRLKGTDDGPVEAVRIPGFLLEDRDTPPAFLILFFPPRPNSAAP